MQALGAVVWALAGVEVNSDLVGCRLGGKLKSKVVRTYMQACSVGC